MKRLLPRIARNVLLGALGLFSLVAWPQEDELLEPDKAFALGEPEVTADAAILTWTIADGYYLYQDKFAFELDSTQTKLGEVKMPAAELKHDEFFGDVMVYKHAVSVVVPLKRSMDQAEELTLNTVVQGCNEPVGVCYPPLHQSVTLSLPAATSESPAATRAGLTALLDATPADDEFLPPDQAFAFSATPTADGRIRVAIDIAEGYYLYREKFAFDSASEGIGLAPYELPRGEIKDDEFLGRTEIIKHRFELDLEPRPQPADGRFSLVAKYQGCAEAGICYPPETRTVDLQLATAATPAASTAPASPATVANASGTPVSEEEGVVAILAAGGLWATVAAFFVFGLALALTPCVFPMIPILSGIIVGQGKDVSRGKALSLSIAYVLGMAIMYTLAGVAAGLTGELLSSAFQDPWVLSVFSLVFVLLSLSMFGFYDLQLPASWQGKLTETSNRIPGGAYGGVFAMGALSALIVGPCVAAPLSGALLYIGQTGDVVLGGVALFVMSLGMGVPLLLIGASAGTLLPRAGAWMDAVKAVFGVLLLAVAVWLISRVIPAAVTLLLWATLLIISAAYLHTFDSLPQDASGWRRLWKGVGLIMTLYGASLFVGALSGASDPLNPLERIAAGSPGHGAAAESSTELVFRDIKGMQQLETALAESSQAGRAVMIDFYADWCVECVRLENTTFKSPAVLRALEGFNLLRVDVTANDEQDKVVLKRFQLFGPPALIFFAPDGRELRAQRVVGYQDSDQFTTTVAGVRQQWGG